MEVAGAPVGTGRSAVAVTASCDDSRHEARSDKVDGNA